MAERQRPQHLRVFLSSPGDVTEEHELARRLLKDELPVDAFLRGRVTFDGLARKFTAADPELTDDGAWRGQPAALGRSMTS